MNGRVAYAVNVNGRVPGAAVDFANATVACNVFRDVCLLHDLVPCLSRGDAPQTSTCFVRGGSDCPASHPGEVCLCCDCVHAFRSCASVADNNQISSKKTNE